MLTANMHYGATRLSCATPTQNMTVSGGGRVYVHFGSFKQLSHQVTVGPNIGWWSQQTFWHKTLIPASDPRM